MSMYPIATSGSLTSAGGFDFTSIPQTFNHLQLRIFGRSTFDRGAGETAPVNHYIRFNSNSSSIYSNHQLSGNGATVSAGGSTTASAVVIGGGNPSFRSNTGMYSNFIIDILDYTSTNKNKVVKAFGGYDGDGYGISTILSSLWASTDAVTSLNIFNDGNYAIGSRFDLYGISNSPMTGA